MERWVEFVQGGKVAGREVVSIVPAAEVKDLMPGPDEPASAARRRTRVEMLKGNEYVRVWINRGGVQYLIHMPPGFDRRVSSYCRNPSIGDRTSHPPIDITSNCS